jgi:hypothetical protein
MSSVHIYGSKYRTTKGGFITMMNKPTFKKSLFIFNDNEREHYSSKPGLGNVSMRPFNVLGTPNERVPRSHGIPTGTFRSGYSKLNNETMNAIDRAVNEIKELLDTYDYDSIVYSLKDVDSLIIGTSIFEVNHEVLVYITQSILSLGSRYYIVDDGLLDESRFIPIDDELLNCIE